MTEDYDGTSSFLPLLLVVVEQTTGPILEMGCGFYSTPILHLLCKKQNRLLMTMENNWEWLKKFQWMDTSWHQFQYVDWKIIVNNIGDQHWNLLFLDQSPYSERGLCLQQLKNNADFIIAHDTQALCYEYDFSPFQSRYDYTRFPPQTTLVSMYHDVHTLFDLGGL